MTQQRQLHLDLNQYLTSDCVRRELKLRADGESDAIAILYEIFDTGIGDLPVLDGLVQGVLLHCMRRGLPLRIHGKLSDTAFHNLHEFQRVWTLWKPQVYRHIDLIPEAVIANSAKSDKVIQAFSGGVDANFTLVANKQLHTSSGGYDIRTAMLVHGFDVAYDNVVGFKRTLARAKKTLDRYGVDIKIVRTNSRLLNIQSWMDSNSAQLAACLHQFCNQYGVALIGSGERYDELALPTGSNPFTDPLLSGNLMRIIHDGASFSRTEKIAVLCNFRDVVEQLKVCWEGAKQHENCGRCEKCLRTRLNFAAAGDRAPSCFPGRFETRMLRKLRARSNLQIIELQSILNYVDKRRLSYPWRRALRRQILLSRLALSLDEAFGLHRVKQSLRNTLRALRNKNPVSAEAVQSFVDQSTGTFPQPTGKDLGS